MDTKFWRTFYPMKDINGHQTEVFLFLSFRWTKANKPFDTSHRTFIEESRPIDALNMTFPTFVLTMGGVISILTIIIELGKNFYDKKKRLKPKLLSTINNEDENHQDFPSRYRGMQY